jgi:hypothetical protein
MPRYRFGSKARDALWFRERINAYLAGRGALPICPHCDQPVLPTDPWDRCHVGAPRWAGGKRLQVGHRPCNQAHNAAVDTPAFAKSNRVRQRHVAGARGSKHPLPCGRSSGKTKTINRGVQPRLTGAEKHALAMAAREIAPG